MWSLCDRPCFRMTAHVGKRVRHGRWMLGLPQKRLAERLQISLDRLQACEQGAMAFSAGELSRIAGIFEMPLAFFFDGTDLEVSASACMPRPGENTAGPGPKRVFTRLGSKYVAPDNSRPG